MSGRVARGNVAIVTCAQARGLDVDDERLFLAALGRRGVQGTVISWDDPGVTWERYDLAVIRSTWDYIDRLTDFLDWAEGVERRTALVNPSAVLRWNVDKAYVRELASARVPVVPTHFAAPGAPPPEVPGPVVVKPAVSAGARDTLRHRDGGSPEAREHVRRLQADGRTAMVQPYVHGVDLHGETALVFVDGSYSHALCKRALLDREREVVAGLFVQEEMSVRTPTSVERAVADLALDTLPFARGDLAYARVDLLPGPDGSPLVLEIELVEPSLYLSLVPSAADRLAAAVTRRLQSPRAG